MNVRIAPSWIFLGRINKRLYRDSINPETLGLCWRVLDSKGTLLEPCTVSFAQVIRAEPLWCAGVFEAKNRFRDSRDRGNRLAAF